MAYQRGKHIPLFIVAILVALLLLVPYTLVVLFLQCLQRRSVKTMFTWVRRLKPILDAYGGPYKDRYRYWPGLLLLSRVALLLAFAVNSLGDPTLDLLFVNVAVTFLLGLKLMPGGIHRSVLLSILETFVFVNLGMLSVATSYVLSSGGSQVAVSSIFIGLVFATFIGVVFYHIYIRTSQWRLCKRTPMTQSAVRLSELQAAIESDSSDSEPDVHQVRGQIVAIDKNCTSGEAEVLNMSGHHGI